MWLRSSHLIPQDPQYCVTRRGVVLFQSAPGCSSRGLRKRVVWGQLTVTLFEGFPKTLPLFGPIQPATETLLITIFPTTFCHPKDLPFGGFLMPV